MAEVQNTSNLIIRNASSHDLVRAILEKTRIIPIKFPHLDQELARILCTPIRRKLARHQVIYNVCILRQLSNGEEIFIGEVITDGRAIGGIIKLESRQMVGNNILDTLFILDGQIKFLQ